MNSGPSVKRAAARPDSESPEDSAGKNAVQAVGVAFEIVQCMADAADPIGVSEISRRLGHTKPRVYRHLTTLRALGFVDKDSATDRYRLSWKIYRLGMAVAESFDLHKVAKRHLVSLRADTGHIVLLAGKADGGATILDTLVGTGDYSIAVRPGSFIGDDNKSTLVRVIRAYDRELPAKPAGDASAAPAPHSVAWIRKYWHDLALNERVVGFGTITCPIFDASDSIVGAVSISGPAPDFSGASLTRLTDRVKRAAADISADLQSTTWQRAPAGARPRPAAR